jgi:predicted RND superfamily exporter protein
LSKDLNVLRKVRDVIQPLPTVASTESILSAYDNYDWLKQHEREMPSVKWADPQPIAADDIPRLATKARALADRYRNAAAGSTTQPAVFDETAKAIDAFATTLASGDHAAQAARLTEWQRVFIGHLKDMLAPFHPPPLEIDKLPATLREHLVGSTTGRFALYINPRDDLWVQSNLKQFVHDVERGDATVPNAPPVTGIAVNIYHSTSSIQRSFYHATAYALALIFVLVLIDLRDIPQTILAISVLAMGLPMLVALMGLFDVSWNFANFFGLPILIGAGHEYGVFMVHRYNEAVSDQRRCWERWDVSDRALLLCAFVTCASFGFFWALGHHQGLKSLGLVMALGIGCIYLATVCMLRPMLLWRLANQKLCRQDAGAAQVPQNAEAK